MCPVYRSDLIPLDAVCDGSPGALYRVAVQSLTLSGPDVSSGDNAVGNRRAVRHLPAKGQPVPEETGEARLVEAGVWRRDGHRPRAIAQLWRVSEIRGLQPRCYGGRGPWGSQHADSNRLWY